MSSELPMTARSRVVNARELSLAMAALPVGSKGVHVLSTFEETQVFAVLMWHEPVNSVPNAAGMAESLAGASLGLGAEPGGDGAGSPPLSAGSTSGKPASPVSEIRPGIPPGHHDRTGVRNAENRSGPSADSSGDLAHCQPLPAAPLLSTPRFKKALALAMRSARSAKREYVCMEDLRAGLDAVEAEVVS